MEHYGAFFAEVHSPKVSERHLQGIEEQLDFIRIAAIGAKIGVTF